MIFWHKKWVYPKQNFTANSPPIRTSSFRRKFLVDLAPQNKADWLHKQTTTDRACINSKNALSTLKTPLKVTVDWLWQPAGKWKRKLLLNYVEVVVQSLTTHCDFTRTVMTRRFCSHNNHPLGPPSIWMCVPASTCWERIRDIHPFIPPETRQQVRNSRPLYKIHRSKIRALHTRE